MYKSLPKNLIFKKTISFVTGRNCNLKCNYCYVNQNNNEKMSLNMATDIINYIFEKEKLPSTGVIYEFIGGEPLLEIELLKHIIQNIKEKQKNHFWENNHIFALCSNGTLFSDPLVKEFLLSNNMSVSLSLDGVKEIHDLNRSNSFDIVMKNFDWWRKHFPNDVVKSTLNHESLPFMFESIKFMINELKLPIIMMNPVFENVWQKNDLAIFKEQLIRIVDFLLEDKRYKHHHISLFNESNVREYEQHNSGWCGCGNSMMAFDYKGDIYPCARFCTSATNYIIGNINESINTNLILPFMFNHNFKNKCFDCKLKHSCPRCLSHDYETNKNIFDRTDFICEMHKIKVDINKYFFDRIKHE